MQRTLRTLYRSRTPRLYEIETGVDLGKGWPHNGEQKRNMVILVMGLELREARGGLAPEKTGNDVRHCFDFSVPRCTV